MEIELRPLIGEEGAGIPSRRELRHLALEEGLVRSHLARLALLVILELPRCRRESIAQRRADRRVGVFLAGAVRLAAHHQRAARQSELDMDVADIAAAVLLV